MMADIGTLTNTSWYENEDAKEEWTVSGNKNADGASLPELYGTLRIEPPKLAEYVESDGTQQTLNALYALSKWSIDSITGIRINGDDIADFPELPPPDIRYGGNVQEVVQAFADLKTDTGVNQELTTSWITFTNLGVSNTGFGIGLSFPQGLCCTCNGIQGQPATVYIAMQFKAHAAVDWVPITQTSEGPSAAGSSHWSGGYWGTDSSTGAALWREIEAGSTTPGDHAEGDHYDVDPGLWSLAGYDSHDYARYVNIWHWVTLGDVIIPEGIPATTDYILITHSLSTAFRSAYFRTGLPAGQYDIRVKLYQNINVDDDVYVYFDTVYFDYYREIIEDDFTYPNVALLSISALPTSKLSGGISTVDLVATRSTVYVYDVDQAIYVTKSATNPAWICYDLIHKARYLQDSVTLAYGITVFGEPHDRLDKYWDWWSGWAAWCDWDGTSPYTDKKPYTCHIYLSEPMSLQDRLDIVGACGRGKVRQIGRYFKPIFEYPEATPTQRFTFCAGDMVLDSFSETFTAATDRANIIEVTYQDPDNYYADETVRVPADDYDSAGTEIKTTAVTFVGCCDRYMAATYGKYLLNRNRYLTALTTWSANVDAIACEPGDIVEAPAEFSGRMLSGCSTTRLVLDEVVVMEVGKTYHIIVNHQDTDVREEVEAYEILTIDPEDPDYQEGACFISVAEMDDAPAQYSRWVFGEDGQEARIRRVISITRDLELTARIVAEEFNSAVFEDDAVIPAYPFDPYHRKMIPPALASVALGLIWKLDSDTKTWIPYVRIQANPDLTFDYNSLSIPLDKIRLFANSDIGDTHLLPMSSATYGTVLDLRETVLDFQAMPYTGRTLYLTAALVNLQGMEGPKCAQAVLYIDTNYTPAATSNVSIDSYDYANNGPAGYTVYFSWIPYGWELSGGKYVPILSWSNGSNYYVFKGYCIVWGIVAADHNIPAVDQLNHFETVDVGNIFAADGAMITDADALDLACRAAASSSMPLSYSEKWVAISIIPIMKNGSANVLDFEQADYGLDWEWIQVTCPGGTGATVEDVQIQNAELVMTMQPGSVVLNEMNWDYTLSSPEIDGFMILYRAQPYWWSWAVNGNIAAETTSLATILGAVDLTSNDGLAAANDLADRYAEWYAGGVPYFYMLIASTTAYELIKINTQTWVVERGVEGTTAQAWAAGDVISYSPCELIDGLAAIMDTNQRSFVFNPPLALNFALHCTIAAVKLVPDAPGYKRSHYAFWDLVRNR